MYATKALPREMWPKEIFAKRKGSIGGGDGGVGQPAKQPQQGPSLPGQERRPGQKRLEPSGRGGAKHEGRPGGARGKPGAAVARPRGQGAGAAEQVQSQASVLLMFMVWRC